MQNKITRVLIVDDHAMVRRGLAAILQTQTDFELAGEASDGEQGLLMYEHTLPDVVLMDLMMPRMDGVATILKLRARHPQAKIIALTSFSSDDLVQQALQAGAVSYLIKNTSSEDLVRAIRTAREGKRTLAPEAADALIHAVNKERTPGSDLTQRERDVLVLMVTGLNNADIGVRLSLSTATIKFYVSTILSKLGVTNRIEAVVLAVKHGIVEISS